jgi:hypothetical protein
MAQRARRLVLNRTHLVEMLSDPEFYCQCSHFLWLRTTAMMARKAFDASNEGTCCGGDFRIMQPVVDAFFTNLRDLYMVEPAAAAHVVTYLEARRGHPISQIVIYYRATRKQKHPQKFVINGGAKDGSQS